MPIHRTVRRGLEIKRARVVGENGRWFSTLCPPEIHGRTSGYIYWLCRCDPCRKRNRQLREEGAERLVHNKAIIERLLKSKPADPPPAPRVVTRGISLPRVEGAAPPVKEEKPRGERDSNVAPVEFTEPLAEGEKFGMPPVTDGVRSLITTVELAEKVKKAYYEPQWSVRQDDGRMRHTYEDVQIIIGDSPEAPVIYLNKRQEVGTGTPELLKPKKKAMPKAKGGGGGSSLPGSLKDLLKRLKDAGCEISRTGSGHIKVEKNGKHVVIPSTASDYRSLANSLADARKNGLL